MSADGDTNVPQMVGERVGHHTRATECQNCPQQDFWGNATKSGLLAHAMMSSNNLVLYR